jgi:hypothetical protein
MNGDSAYTYPATIIPDPANILQVELTNVANNFFTHNVTGRVSNDTLTIPYQAPDSNGAYIAGQGVLNSNLLVINFTISYQLSGVPHTDYYFSQWLHP